MLALFADPFKRAAMQAVSLPIADLITDSPAAEIAGIHCIRAEIALLILTLAVLTSNAGIPGAESGLHRLLAIPMRLKARSPQAAPSLEIPQQLARHVKEK